MTNIIGKETARSFRGTNHRNESNQPECGNARAEKSKEANKVMKTNTNTKSVWHGMAYPHRTAP